MLIFFKQYINYYDCLYNHHNYHHYHIILFMKIYTDRKILLLKNENINKIMTIIIIRRIFKFTQNRVKQYRLNSKKTVL
jgi:hypothetical protein